MTHCRKPLFFKLIVALSILFAPAGRRTDQARGEGLPPEAVSLATKDGVQLRATYFPGAARKGSTQAKQTTPVILLHDYKSTRTVFTPLARKLQTPGEPGADRPYFAAIIVDLRGHGESTKYFSPDGTTAELDAAKLSKEGLFAMASLDMEAVRSFLVDKNDAGELNLNKLCLVGSGMGANVAVNWAQRDWAAPPLAVGKQGQDVKGIVLVSPRWSFNGLSMQDPMKFALLKQNVAWLLICGAQDQKLRSDLARIQKQLERFHPPVEKSGAQGRSGLDVIEVPSSLQGDTLIGKLGETIDAEVIKFLTDNVAAVPQPWINRRNRLP
jgi:pimeloyl-ACP methyl ester carboxylesterase